MSPTFTKMAVALVLLLGICHVNGGRLAAHTKPRPSPVATRETTITTFPNYFTTTEYATLPVTITKTQVTNTVELETRAPLLTATIFNIIDATDTQTMHVGAQLLHVTHITSTTTLNYNNVIVTQTFVEPSTVSIPSLFYKTAVKIEPTTEYATLTPTIIPSSVTTEKLIETSYATVSNTIVSTEFETITTTSDNTFTSLSANITITLTTTAIDPTYDTTSIILTSTSTKILPTISTVTYDVTRTSTEFVPITDTGYIDVTIIDYIVDNNGRQPSYVNYYVSPTVSVTVFQEQEETTTSTVTVTDSQVKAYTEAPDVDYLTVTDTVLAVVTQPTIVYETKTIVVTPN